MDWITAEIAVGSHHEAQMPELLRQHSIRSILGLTATLRGRVPAELGVEQVEVITLLDGPGNEVARFRRAIDTLARLVAEAPPVLVHCRAGWSRSPAVVAGYLMLSSGESAEEALARVAARRTLSMVPEMRELLERLEETLGDPPP